MKNALWIAGLAATAVLLWPGQDKAPVRTVDGVPHVLNPARPLNGTVALELELTRTIDPFDQPDVGMKMVLFSRDPSGQVVLYDPNGAEVHRFAPDGTYLGPLIQKGQGPGEFGSAHGVRFFGPDIWAYGDMKAARFDPRGRFLDQRLLPEDFDEGIDARRYFASATSWNDKKEQVRTLKLVELAAAGKDRAVTLLHAENIGMIRRPDGRGGFGEGWGTPNFYFEADPERARVFCGLNTEYRIQAKDYDGKTLLVVEKAYDPVKVRLPDLEKLMPWALQNERLKWIFDAYPDRFVAITDVRVLPRGHFGAFRVSGPGTVEVDVFSPEGRCLYALAPPKDVQLNEAQFFSAGFAVIEQDGDGIVYREYRIKNLPSLFGD